MMGNNLEHLLPVQNEIGETPIWIAKEQALYWIDYMQSKVYRFDATTGEYKVVDVKMPITGLYPRTGGGWITATRAGLAFWEYHRNEFTFIVDPEAQNPALCCNDAVVDRQGRFLVGTMNEQNEDSADGSLYRLDTGSALHKLDTGFAVANGIGLSIDGRTLYLTDMFHRQILAFDYDILTGIVHNRRVWVHVPETAGMPDGLIVDSEDFVWSAHWGGWRVTRYDPTGKIERKVRLPVANATCLGFGGQDLDELYITTAWYELTKQERKQQPLAGDLFRIKTDVKGLPESEFLG
jgi:sugar lactone lactonase YvrE